MKRILCLVMVLALIGGLAACTAIPGLGPAVTPTPAAKKLKPQGATPQGYVTPVRYADLAFLTGGRVAQVLVAEGDVVKAGQPLVKLQDADLKAALAPEEIQAAQARVDQAQAALDQATLTAPFDGTIAQLDARPGEMAGPAIRIASIADLANWVIETDDLSETDVVNVQPGANVAVTLDALPGVSLRGRVQSITPRSAVKRGAVTYMVKITLADSDPRLRWGMTAFVDVLAK